MIPTPRPRDESARLEALRETGLLDSAPEPQFDALAALAARLCDAPLGAVTLVDEARVWFKARAGALPPESPREGAFCAWTILGDSVLVVPDASADPRFAGAPALPGAQPPVRFYAGCPLRTAAGRVLGTLCVMDHEPRFSPDGREVEALSTLAAQVVAHLELRSQAARMARANAELARTCALLSEKEARLRAILDTAAEGIITMNERGVVESFNPAAERIFGWDASEVVGRSVAVLMPAPDGERHDGYVKQYLGTGRARIIGLGRETVARRRDGAEFPVYLAISEVRIGTQRIFTGFVRDISERKEIDRMKDEFVSVVSHELRTPLTSIRGSLGLLEAGIGGALDERGTELVGIARGNTDRLIRLINDILDLEKIETGKMELCRQPTAAREVIEATLEGLGGLAAQAEVRLEAEAAPDAAGAEAAARALEVDRDRIVQVLTNLVGNAIKFSPRGAAVRVRAVALADGGGWRFEVSDRGPGIPAPAQGRLFTRFQQLDSSDRRHKGGSGLGLAISRALVEQHGGRIGVHSVVGEGSTFWFELPQHADRGAPETKTA